MFKKNARHNKFLEKNTLLKCKNIFQNILIYKPSFLMNYKKFNNKSNKHSSMNSSSSSNSSLNYNNSNNNNIIINRLIVNKTNITFIEIFKLR